MHRWAAANLRYAWDSHLLVCIMGHQKTLQSFDAISSGYNEHTTMTCSVIAVSDLLLVF